MQIDLVPSFLDQWALFDDSMAYRYQLGRRWSPGPTVLWVMLNPSTADDIQLDPTLKGVLKFSQEMGFGCFEVGNVYGLRSPYPEDLWKVPDPVGPDNLHHLEVMSKRVDKIMIGWGKHAKPEHVAPVLDIFARVDKPPHCLVLNADGSPRHPLYIKRTTKPLIWTAP